MTNKDGRLHQVQKRNSETRNFFFAFFATDREKRTRCDENRMFWLKIDINCEYMQRTVYVTIFFPNVLQVQFVLRAKSFTNNHFCIDVCVFIERRVSELKCAVDSFARRILIKFNSYKYKKYELKMDRTFWAPAKNRFLSVLLLLLLLVLMPPSPLLRLRLLFVIIVVKHLYGNWTANVMKRQFCVKIVNHFFLN